MKRVHHKEEEEEERGETIVRDLLYRCFSLVVYQTHMTLKKFLEVLLGLIVDRHSLSEFPLIAVNSISSMGPCLLKHLYRVKGYRDFPSLESLIIPDMGDTDTGELIENLSPSLKRLSLGRYYSFRLEVLTSLESLIMRNEIGHVLGGLTKLTNLTNLEVVNGYFLEDVIQLTRLRSLKIRYICTKYISGPVSLPSLTSLTVETDVNELKYITICADTLQSLHLGRNPNFNLSLFSALTQLNITNPSSWSSEDAYLYSLHLRSLSTLTSLGLRNLTLVSNTFKNPLPSLTELVIYDSVKFVQKPSDFLSFVLPQLQLLSMEENYLDKEQLSLITGLRKLTIIEHVPDTCV